MGETQHQQQQLSRLGLKSTRAGTGAGGQIVEVQGGHVVRSTGRKDRHSKVCTAKGPRDRRVRLSAHTAIQFYDVQDRLGYDRPSKAVDWLIKKAKAAIDELAELPPWHPTANTSQLEQTREAEIDSAIVGSSKRAMGLAPLPVPTLAPPSGYAFRPHQELNNSNCSSFLPPSLDSDAIADTIKSFFPMGAATSSSSPIHFQNYPHELVSRTSSHAQDLRLSLQSSQDPILLHHHHFTPSSSAEQPFFSSWLGQQQVPPEISRFQRMVAWNAAAEPASEVGFHFNSPPPLPQQALLGQNPLFYQRGPLQSSNSPSVRAWIDMPASTTADHHYTPVGHPSSISSIGFASVGGSGFRIPARIQGEEEQQDTVSSKPSSASHH